MELLRILEARFQKNMRRHAGLRWEDTAAKLDMQKLASLRCTEENGGEADIVCFSDGRIAFVDCCRESPAFRRSLCYDRVTRVACKNFLPKSSAEEMVKVFGCRLLLKEEYLYLQRLEDFDLKTSSWIATPKDIRALGGSLFGNKKYGRCFIYYNGADAYYASRGFRCILPL